MVEVKERRKREGVNAKVYEPKLFKLDDLEDFDSWHYVYQLIFESKYFFDAKIFLAFVVLMDQLHLLIIAIQVHCHIFFFSHTI